MESNPSDLYTRGFNVPIVVKHSRSLTHNNIAELSGQITGPITLHHECYNRSFYRFSVRTLDFSPYELPVVSSEYAMERARQQSGKSLDNGSWVVMIHGAWRSYNEPSGQRTKLTQCFYAKTINVAEKASIEYKNRVLLDGYICRGGHPTDPKAIFVRTTPQTSRKIVDVLIAINRPRGPVNKQGFTPTKTDYLPLLFWDEWTEEAVKLKVGDRIQVVAIMQSRVYDKVVGYDENKDTILKKNTAYELTATHFRVIDEVLVEGPNK